MAERPGRRQQGSQVTVHERVEFADPRDIVGDARRSAREEIKKANTDAKKKDLAQTFINEFNDKSSTATRNLRKLEKANRVDSDYVNVNEKLTRLLEGVKANVVPIPTDSGKTVLNQLGSQDLGHQEALYLYSIVDKILTDPNKNYLTFSTPGATAQTDVEKDFINLTAHNADAAHTLREALQKAAQQGFLNITEDQLKARLEEFNKEVESVRRQAEKQYEDAVNKQISKEEKRALDEKRQLLRQYSETDTESIRVIHAIYDENTFVQYIKEMLDGLEETKDGKTTVVEEGLRKKIPEYRKIIVENYHAAHKKVKRQQLQTQGLAADEIERQSEAYAKQEIDRLIQEGRIEREAEEVMYQKLSDELKLRIVKMVSKLYSIVDKADPTELWQEATSRGATLYYNITSLNRSIQTALTRLSDTDFEKTDHKDFIKKLNFYRQINEEFTIEVDTKSRYTVKNETPYNKAGEHAIKKEDRTFIKPRNVHDRLGGLSDYMTTVINAITTEVGVRQFLHDARALPYRETGQTSYWDMMAGFARQHLKSGDVDSLYSLFNGDEILSASRLWDKLNETNFARDNWNYRAAAGQLDPDLKLTDVDQKTRDYLEKIYGKKLEDWEIWRILSIAVGDNFGITIRGITTGALADPPLRDSNPTYISYGPKDSVMYTAFNHLAHVSMRFQPEGLFWGNLIFLPIDGSEEYLRSLGDNWDHNVLLEQMQNAMNAFTVGKNPEDVKNKIVRFADITNVGKVGSIYDRGGWRSYYAYEGWFVRDNNNKVDVVESWKALEGVGIEAIKDFIGHLDEFAQDADFFKDGEANVAKRKKLMMHLYERYINEDEDGEKLPFDEKKFKKLFDDLEKEKPNIEKAKQGTAPIKTRKENYEAFLKNKILGKMFFQRIPTKYIRAESERTRKVSAERKRAWEEVYEPTPPKKNEKPRLNVKQLLEIIATIDGGNVTVDEQKKAAYVQAIQDLCAAEVLLREDATKTMKETIDTREGRLNEVDLSNYNLTPKRLKELWEKHQVILIDKKKEEYTEKGINWERDVDQKRKDNALLVLKAIRQFAINADGGKFVENFHEANKNSNFALAVEELERSLIPQRLAGETIPQRAYGDISLVEKEVVGNLQGFYQTLFSASIDGKHNFHGIIEKIQKVKDTLEGVHGKDYAHRIAIYMSRMAIAYYKLDGKIENSWVSTAKRWGTSEHTSLASVMAGGEVGKVWEWDRATIRTFIDDLILRRVLPYEPYEIKKTRDEIKFYKYHKVIKEDGTSTHELDKDANGKPIEVPKLRELKPDYHHFAEQLEEQFLNHPLRETFSKMLPIAVIFILLAAIMTVWQGFKSADGKK